MPQSAAVIRSYRIYFRDARHGIASVHEVDLASDDEAYQLAELALQGVGQLVLLERDANVDCASAVACLVEIHRNTDRSLSPTALFSGH